MPIENYEMEWIVGGGLYFWRYSIVEHRIFWKYYEQQQLSNIGSSNLKITYDILML